MRGEGERVLEEKKKRREKKNRREREGFGNAKEKKWGEEIAKK